MSPLFDHLGKQLRAWRAEEGSSQEDLAHLVRLVGLNWTPSKIAQIESGKRRLSLDELLALVFATGRPLKQWLDPGDGVLWITDSLILSSEAMKAITASRQPKTGVTGAVFSYEIELMPDALKAFGSKVLHNPEASQEVALYSSYQAELAAAGRFGVDVTSIVLASRQLWGSSLSVERDKRMQEWVDKNASDKRSVQAFRGHVTRQLYVELGDLLDDLKAKGFEL